MDLGRRSIPVQPRRRVGRIPGSDSNPLMPYQSFFLGTFCSARLEVKVNSLRYRRGYPTVFGRPSDITDGCRSPSPGRSSASRRTEGPRDSGSRSGNPVGRRRLNCRPCLSRPVNHRLPGRIPFRCAMAPRDSTMWLPGGVTRFPLRQPSARSEVLRRPSLGVLGRWSDSIGPRATQGSAGTGRRSAACSSVSAMAIRGSPRSLIRSRIRMAFRRYFGS